MKRGDKMVYGKDTPEVTLMRCRTQAQDILRRLVRVCKEDTIYSASFDLAGVRFDAERIIELTNHLKWRNGIVIDTPSQDPAMKQMPSQEKDVQQNEGGGKD